MSNDQKLENTSKLYKMLTFALQIDDLEMEKNLQKYEVSDVFITVENKICVNSEYSSYSVVASAEILHDNPKDYQLCLIPMDRFDTQYIREFDKIFANIEEYDNGKIYFERKQAIKNFAGKRYHLKFIPNRYPYRACMSAVDQVKRQIAPYFRNFQGLQFAMMSGMRHFFEYDFIWKNKDVTKNVEQKLAIRQIVNCSAYPSPYVSYRIIKKKK